MSQEITFNTTAAAVALLGKGVELAKRAYNQDPNDSVIVGKKWVPLARQADSAVFRLADSPFDGMALARATAVGELREAPETSAFAEALAQDPALAPYLGKMVFSGGAGMTMSAEAIADTLVHIALRDNDWDALPDAAQKIWADFVNASLREQDQLTLVAPLTNFQGPAGGFALGEGVVVDQMTDDEISRAISVGAVTTPFPGSTSGDFWVRSLWAVRIAYMDARIFTAPEESPAIDVGEQRRERAMARATGVVHALLLFKSGLVSAEIAMLFGEAVLPFLGEWTQRFPLSTKTGRGGPTYELNAHEATEFGRFHNALVKARAAHPPLDVAVRRFGDAAGRIRADDQLTDLIISLEALLLNDSERGEKRFQVALRVAAFVKIGGTKRRDVFKFVKRAYDVRSSIVHGGSPRPTYLRNIAGADVELQAFADEAMEVVRRVLRQVTERVEETGEFSVDWEVQLLGDE